MKKLLTLLFCPLMAFQAQAQVPAVLEAKFKDTLDDMHAKYHFRGLSAAVSFKGMGVWKSAVGMSSATTPLSSDMMIGIGSNTKTFVSAMMLKLVENGKVKLTDTIGTWLPGYTNIKGSITIRQILNHTSGLNNYTNNALTWDSVNKDLGRLWTKEEILRKFVLAPTFAPGASWEYSNTNFIIAGVIEEQLMGVSIQKLLRDSIISTRSYTHTFFPPYETATAPYAHLWSDFDGDGVLDDVGEYATSAILPKEINSVADAAGALVSTAEDNVHFWEDLMQGRIISKSTLRNDMLKWTGFGSATSEYGLGIMRSKYLGNTIFSHGGTWIGQTNENLSDTLEQIYITVLSNQDSLQNPYVAEVVKALYKVALDYKKLAVEDPAVTALKLYPNPAAATLYLDYPGSDAQRLGLYDLSGRLVKEVTGLRPAMQISVDVADLAEGTYLLKLDTGSGTKAAAVVVRH